MLAQGLLPTTIRVEARHQRGLIASFFFSLGRRVGKGMGSNFAGEKTFTDQRIFLQIYAKICGYTCSGYILN